MAIHKVTLDVDKTAALAAEIITMRVGDSGEVIEASLLKSGAALTGATSARFVALKPDRTFAEQTASVSGSTATVTLDPRFLSASGVIKTAYFSVTTGGKGESTPDVWINVLPDAESQSDDPAGPYVSEIEGLKDQLNAIKAQMQTATGSASRAAASANEAASDARSAASAATSAAGEASSAASSANEAEGAATEAAADANRAASSANEAAGEATDAAAEARAAAGMVSADKSIFMEYDEVGGIAYLTLTDKGE